ncbi:MAG: phage portal protein [Anaerolineaceae bacterium]|nr:phage portal protein [Anaerolineaceae bacterium]
MFNWLTNLFVPRRGRGLRPAPHLEAVARHNAFAWPNLAETGAQTHVYSQSPWVFVAINRIAEAAALVPLRVLRLEGERRVEVQNHPLETLLDAPNPYLSRFELIEQTIGMLELTGNAYWFLAGDAAGVPAQIWPLRPDRVSIVPDPLESVKGYLYEIDGQRIPLDPVEVVHFKRWHPANDYYGLSALEAARLAVQSDRAMAQWNYNTFGQDNGVPAGIVSIQGGVSDADYERVKREWRASFGGGQRRTAVLRGEAIQWQNIGLNHNELDFLKGREAHRDAILNIFGIPVGLISHNATEANATVAERQFIERTLWPKLVRLSQKITQELLPFWPGTHQVIFEDIRPTDTQARLEEIRTAYPVLTINEIRQRYFQLPAVTWGEMAVESSVVSSQSSDSGNQPATIKADNTPGEAGHRPYTALSTVPQDTTLKTQDCIDELARWERFTLKRWGQANPRPFEVRALPDELAFEITAELLGADTPEAARAVFHSARERLAGLETP